MLTTKSKLPILQSDDDMERMCSILCPDVPVNENNEFEPPVATMDMLERYLTFITPYLEPGLRLKASESMGYFSWEERYIWSSSDSIKKEHKRLKKEYASTTDILKIVSIQGIDEESGISLKVRRPKDDKNLVIPLADLRTIELGITANQIIDDYACYITNFLDY